MRCARRGLMMVEVVTSAALLGVLIVVSLKLVAATAMQQRAIERRAMAQQEAANLVERITALSFEKITAQRLNEFGLSSDVQQALPGGAAKLTALASAEGPPAKQIRVEITWTSLAGDPELPVRLSSWVYQPAGAPSP